MPMTSDTHGLRTQLQATATGWRKTTITKSARKLFASVTLCSPHVSRNLHCFNLTFFKQNSPLTKMILTRIILTRMPSIYTPMPLGTVLQGVHSKEGPVLATAVTRNVAEFNRIPPRVSTSTSFTRQPLSSVPRLASMTFDEPAMILVQSCKYSFRPESPLLCTHVLSLTHLNQCQPVHCI